MEQQQLIDGLLIPRMYMDAESLFDGYDFKKSGNKKVSHLRHIDGREGGGGKAPNVVIYEGAHVAVEFGDGTLDGSKDCELVKWYAYLRKIDRGEAIKQLCARYHLEKEYNDTFTSKPVEVDAEKVQRSIDLDVALTRMCMALHDGENPAGCKALAYMKGRDWTMEEIERAGLGVFDPYNDPSTSESIPAKVKEQWNGAIGKVHTIAIPLRVNGRLDRFQFRTTQTGGDVAKYMSEFGNKTTCYGDVGSRCIIVEGALDYSHALANGVQNVLCTAGKPSKDQLTSIATSTIIKTVLLSFDNDNAGRQNIVEWGKALSQTGKAVLIFTPKTGADGRECKDLDDYLTSATRAGWSDQQKQKGVEDMIENAVTFDDWRAQGLECSFVESILNRDRAKGDRLHVAQVTDAMVSQVLERIGEAVEVKDGGRPWRWNEKTRKKFAEGVRKMFSELKPSSHEKAVETLERWHHTTKGLFCDISALKVEGVELSHTAKKNATTGNVEGENRDPAEIYGVLVPHHTTFEGILQETETIATGVPSFFAFPSYLEGGQLAELQYISFFPGLTLLCANTGHGKTSILNAVALYDARRNMELKNNKVTLYLSFEIEKGVIIMDLLNLYNNDPALSKKGHTPTWALRRYFGQKMYDTPSKAKIFNDGEWAPGVTHFQHFESSMKDFFTNYLCEGGTLHVVKETFYYEELVEGLTWYMESLKGDPSFAGKEISMICIDYAQLLLSKGRTAQRTEEIKKIVQGLNNLAKSPQFNVPIVMCAQFNQQVNTPAKISVTCIGEGGDFSRYADTVIGFYNLGKLRPTGDTSDGLTGDDLAGVGLTVPKPLPSNGELEGLMFARLLKTRNGAYPRDAIFRWEGVLKKIHPNCNTYIADVELTRAKNLKYGEALESGRKEMRETAKAIKENRRLFEFLTHKGDSNLYESIVIGLSEKVMESEDGDEILRYIIEQNTVEGDLPSGDTSVNDTPAPPRTATPSTSDEDENQFTTREGEPPF